MAVRLTQQLTVTVAHPDVASNAAQTVTNSLDDEMLTISPVKLTEDSEDSTGVGASWRTTVKTGLRTASLGTVVFMFNAATATDGARMAKAWFDSSSPARWVFTYASGVTITTDQLCTGYEVSSDVGGALKVTTEWMPSGAATYAGF